MIRPMVTCALLATAVGLASVPTMAETFRLRSGETIDGRIIHSAGRTLSVKLPERGMRQLPISAIERVEIELVSRDIISGELIGWSDQVYEVKTGGRLVSVENGKVIADVAAASLPKKNNQKVLSGPRLLPGEAETEPAPVQPRDQNTVDVAFAIPMLEGSAEPVDEGAREAVFVLRLSRPVSTPVAILYSAVQGEARSGSDYRDSSGVVTIEPGELRATVTVPLVDDDIAESSEAFELFLTVDPSAAELKERHIAAVILDND